MEASGETQPAPSDPPVEPDEVETQIAMNEAIEEDNAEIEVAFPRPWMRSFLAALAGSGNISASCRQIGISDESVRVWRLRDESFAIACLRAIDRAAELLEEQALTWATTGVMSRVTTTKEKDGKVIETTERVSRLRSPALLTTLLRATKPEKYRENVRIENTGPGGGPLEHKVSIVDEAKADFYAELDRVGSSG